MRAASSLTWCLSMILSAGTGLVACAEDDEMPSGDEDEDSSSDSADSEASTGEEGSSEGTHDSGEESGDESSDAETESSEGADDSDEASSDDSDESGDDASSSDDETTSSGDDDSDTDESDTSEEDECVAPDPHQDWVRDMQDELVAKLTGEREVAPGQSLGVRASASERAAARNFLREFWQPGDFSVLEHSYQSNGANLYVEIPATENPDSAEVVVFGAHFDSVAAGPGANDNATGVAAVVSASRYIASFPCRQRTWIFALFDEEESGLVGSAAFAQWLKDEGYPVLEVHTIDQMGWDQDGDRAIELERADSGLGERYDAALAALSLDFPLHRTDTGSTDHVSFRDAGFEAIGITEEYVNGDTTPHYHKSTDTYETVNFDYLLSTTTLIHQMAATLTWSAARTDGR
jgi:hypothetical protein